MMTRSENGRRTRTRGRSANKFLHKWRIASALGAITFSKLALSRACCHPIAEICFPYMGTRSRRGWIYNLLREERISCRGGSFDMKGMKIILYSGSLRLLRGMIYCYAIYRSPLLITLLWDLPCFATVKHQASRNCQTNNP